MTANPNPARSLRTFPEVAPPRRYRGVSILRMSVQRMTVLQMNVLQMNVLRNEVRQTMNPRRNDRQTGVLQTNLQPGEANR